VGLKAGGVAGAESKQFLSGGDGYIEACKKIALKKVADVDRFSQSAHDLKESFGAAYLLDRMMESAEADTRRRLWVQICMEERGYKYQLVVAAIPPLSAGAVF
jgi:hypothetical protein